MLLPLAAVCALATSAADLALVGGRIYTAPDAAPLTNGTVLIHDGRIAAIGAGTLKLPGGIQRLDCTGLVIAAGFWNCHVHFSEPKWENAATLPVTQLATQIRDMFTAARIERLDQKIQTPQGERRVTVDDWVQVFKKKRDEVVNQRCPQ